ncbi:hypothetical protein [Halobacterium yunchengense]|uniref:hypothetical protein n=1 Tax=Halobacterium yunchengense TaxID=3108497 RepID=UPI003009A68C
MNALRAVGAVATVAGVAGYVAGVLVAYPGRAFSITAVVVGVTLLSVAAGENGEVGA